MGLSQRRILAETLRAIALDTHATRRQRVISIDSSVLTTLTPFLRTTKVAARQALSARRRFTSDNMQEYQTHEFHH